MISTSVRRAVKSVAPTRSNSMPAGAFHTPRVASVRAKTPATKPLGGKARSASFCRGSDANTQGKYNAELAACAPVFPVSEAATVAACAASSQSAIRNARRAAASACSIAVAAASARPGTQIRLNASIRRPVHPAQSDVQGLRKRRIGRRDRAAISAHNAQHIRVPAAIVIEMAYGITEQRARIEAAEVPFVIGEAGKKERPIMGPDGDQPTNSAIEVGAPAMGGGLVEISMMPAPPYRRLGLPVRLRFHVAERTPDTRRPPASGRHAYSAASAGGFTLARNSSTSTRLFSE